MSLIFPANSLKWSFGIRISGSRDWARIGIGKNLQDRHKYIHIQLDDHQGRDAKIIGVYYKHTDHTYVS
jgi:hypothetical protein